MSPTESFVKRFFNVICSIEKYCVISVFYTRIFENFNKIQEFMECHAKCQLWKDP